MQNYESNELLNFPSPPIKKDILSPDSLPVSPDNPPWNSWTAVGVWLASIAFIIILQNLFLFPYLKNQPIDLTDQTALTEFAKTDPTAVLLLVIANIPAHLLTLLVAWLVVTRIRKFSFRETVGWRWNGFNIWTCLVIIGGFFILLGIASYLFPQQNNDFQRMLETSRTVVFIVAFLATFTAPLVEEVVYRGVLYSALQRSIGIPSAITLVTLLFALVHVPQYWGSPATLALLLLFSLVLTLLRWRTQNLLPCIALHTALNGTQSLLLILQPYIEEFLKNHQPQAAALIHLFK